MYFARNRFSGGDGCLDGIYNGRNDARIDPSLPEHIVWETLHPILNLLGVSKTSETPILKDLTFSIEIGFGAKSDRTAAVTLLYNGSGFHVYASTGSVTGFCIIAARTVCHVRSFAGMAARSFVHTAIIILTLSSIELTVSRVSAAEDGASPVKR